MYYVIYDGNCNLCVNLVKNLETIDAGQLFHYVPMQNESLLWQLGVTPQDCEKGMILIDSGHPERRWQGSNAAEEIGRLVPAGKPLVDLYRVVPGMKWLGDRAYEHIRDNRYAWFGQRQKTYESAFPIDPTELPSEIACEDGSCR